MLEARQEQSRGPRTLCRGHKGDIPFPRSPLVRGTQLLHHQAPGAAGSQVLGCPFLALAEVAGQGGGKAGPAVGSQGSPSHAAPPGPIRTGAAQGLASPCRQSQVRGQCI